MREGDKIARNSEGQGKKRETSKTWMTMEQESKIKWVADFAHL